jgi:hypothetical protein
MISIIQRAKLVKMQGSGGKIQKIVLDNTYYFAL